MDWAPENIIEVLRESAGFSVSVFADLEELQSDMNTKLSKRSLPLGSILKRHEMLPEKLRLINAKLILAATTEDVKMLAEALEDGADINTVFENSQPPLRYISEPFAVFCLHKSATAIQGDQSPISK